MLIKNMLCLDTLLYPMRHSISFIPVQDYSATVAPTPLPYFKGQSQRVSRSKKNKRDGKKRFKHEQQCNVNALKCKAISSSIQCVSLWQSLAIARYYAVVLQSIHYMKKIGMVPLTTMPFQDQKTTVEVQNHWP